MPRRFPPPWTVEKIPGGFKVLDANQQSLAYVYSRENSATSVLPDTVSMKNAPGLVLLTLCLAAPAQAQTGSVQALTGTIAGVVIDDRTEQPIRGVSVYVESQANIVETDANGRFSLTAPRGPQTIIASVIGYALLRADIEVAEAPLDMTIRLSEGAGAVHGSRHRRQGHFEANPIRSLEHVALWP